jgi:hypothetical protein
MHLEGARGVARERRAGRKSEGREQDDLLKNSNGELGQSAFFA